MGPGPEIVIVRIWLGNGTGNQPVKGTCFLNFFFVNLIIVLSIYLYIPTAAPCIHRTMLLRTEPLCSVMNYHFRRDPKLVSTMI